MTLEERIQRLEDIEAIRATWHDYMLSLDTLNWEALGDVFTEDATVEHVGFDAGDGVWQGRESIIDDCFRVWETEIPRDETTEEWQRQWSGHHGSNLRIDLDGDEATTKAYFFEMTNLAVAGNYQHRMRRDEDRWRIAHLRIEPTFRLQFEVVSPRTRFLEHPGASTKDAI